MELYTRLTIIYVRNSYILLHEGSDGSMEREATALYQQIQDDGNEGKLAMYLKFAGK